MLSDANIMAVRTTETCDALADVLCATLALVPAMSTPSRLRQTAEGLAKRIRLEVAKSAGRRRGRHSRREPVAGARMMRSARAVASLFAPRAFDDENAA
jgi:hypothetical protein